ncbi:hypothetical protein FIBSPDRAFT_899079 [Athelia psychrophila]|uniref:Uncharacterized protein n=1 Tax=Athelia psychrophila TaxID=1759441 RepID=A0A166A658_9AGAM|nr:hypothetical protein FIBSPDRAFT_899079 [Fibularhizoctonia sp. CBS 109695]
MYMEADKLKDNKKHTLKRNKAGNKATTNIVVEDELLSFKLVLQAPAEDQLNDVVFSFKVAIIRPTTWVDAVSSDIKPEHAVMFQCDVLCDTNNMSPAQIETLGRGVDLWQEELDMWGMIDNDRRCYEMCVRPVFARSTLLQEGTAILWDSVKLDPIPPQTGLWQGKIPLEVWSMSVISNLNATLQDRQDGTGYQQFLMPQQPHTIESQEFVIKFLKVCTNSEKVDQVTVKIIRHSFYNSGFMLAKLFRWMMENEDEIQKMLMECVIPPRVFSK